MHLQQPLLLTAERPDQIGALDAPAAQRLAGRPVLAQPLAIGIEADPVPVEQRVPMG